jgi:uncharacterized protein (DUF302 family)
MVKVSQTNIGIKVRLNLDFETALKLVTESLKTEGFGVLTEIDVKATLKDKLGVDFRPYRILGACNPPLAYKALSAEPEAGLLLPCNVTVSEEAEEVVEIAMVDPLAMLGIMENSELKLIAEDANARLERVASLLEQQASS